MEGILIPQQVFIGDKAEFLFPLNQFNNFDKEKINLNNIDKIENSQITITKIEFKKQDKIEYLSISFIPWETGKIEFPSLAKIGLNETIPKVSIASILETKKINLLQPPRAPILIPRTTQIIYGFTIGITTIILSSFFLFSNIKKRMNNSSYSKVKKKRIKFFYKDLKRLQKQVNNKISFKPSDKNKILINKWFKEFEIALKKYCLSIIEKNISMYKKTETKLQKSLTYTEILTELKKEFSNNKNIYLEFKDIFYNLQNSRFGKNNFNNIDITTMSYLINKSYYIVKISEEQIEKEVGVKYDKIQ